MDEKSEGELSAAGAEVLKATSGALMVAGVIAVEGEPGPGGAVFSRGAIEAMESLCAQVRVVVSELHPGGPKVATAVMPVDGLFFDVKSGIPEAEIASFKAAWGAMLEQAKAPITVGVEPFDPVTLARIQDELREQYREGMFLADAPAPEGMDPAFRDAFAEVGAHLERAQPYLERARAETEAILSGLVVTQSRPIWRRGRLTCETHGTDSGPLRKAEPDPQRPEGHKSGAWEPEPERWVTPFTDEQLRRLRPDETADGVTVDLQSMPVAAVCPEPERGQWLICPLPTSIEGWADECEIGEVWLVHFGRMTLKELEELDEFDGW